MLTLVVVMLTPPGQQLWAVLLDPSGEQAILLLRTTPLWLPLVIVGLMVLHTLIPVPAEIIALVAGRVLGPFWGFVTVWLGAMLGAYLGFWLARVFGQPVLRYVVTPSYLNRVQQQLQQINSPLLVGMRLLPILSFNMVNYALGLTTITWWQFTWTTGLGIIPVTVCVVVFGAYLHAWKTLLLITSLGILAGGGGYWLVRRYSRDRTAIPASRHDGVSERLRP
jgi:uncharacterized membrane protein YdjX (TVP38/TMEM64 family)